MADIPTQRQQLAQLARHIVQAEVRLNQQRTCLEQLRARGEEARSAEALLSAMERAVQQRRRAFADVLLAISLSEEASRQD